MDTTFQIIRDIAEDTDGIITTKQIEAAGISRTRIRSLLELGFLIKEAQGIYTLANMLVDEYKLIQLRSEKIVFSYGTALEGVLCPTLTYKLIRNKSDMIKSRIQ